MSTAARLKRAAHAAVERRADAIEALSGELMHTPEPGYAEHATAARFGSWLEDLGLTPRTGLAGTGVGAVLPGRGDGPRVALVGELDALVLPEHPLADPATGAAHACGHHAQIAAVAGAAAGLREVMAELDGSVALIAAPAEELGEADALLDAAAGATGGAKRSDRAEFPVGKAELLRTGAFDGVDMALLAHTGRGGGPRFSVGDTLNGSCLVRARFGGRSAHAGSSPWLGVNALKAATVAAHALDAQREAFPEDDRVRINYLVTGGHGTLGSVPASAALHAMVRAVGVDALRGAAEAVARCARAGALALGARVETDTLLAYLPLQSAPALDDVVSRNAGPVVGDAPTARGRHLGACTDMGDLAHVMPVSHPYCGGAAGDHHSSDYRVVDHRAAAVEPALYLAGTVVDLLCEGAGEARRVLRESPPRMSVPEYLALRRSITRRRTWEEA
ncbi:M20/M25/M40 family metallo-hydrolase [Streptomonospora wellingtoniae]|uniref:M20/M25/M40 family metallo-hydrolase n=1 Tax=Streptomonospora wellingtoniae TaxID=3075544 RepID=A0ABU2KNY3_9ACTN|nr:M20/M25/M40 family metallo-hydrolase [Streptomonospora sp. DSM 45055]MDT0300848.1 M20/M25/M40 family metallo-hydrolase [Streptomonospora sp. DSM 45055]